MKKVKFALPLLLSLVVTTGHAQLKVDSYGRVGVGTLWPNPDNQLHVIKNILVSNPTGTNYKQLILEANGASFYPRIHSSNLGVEFYSTSWAAYVNVYAGSFVTMSDSTCKSNITASPYGINEILKLRPVRYTVNSQYSDSIGKGATKSTTKLGFISQEVKGVFPGIDITTTLNGKVLMEYDQLIPLLVSSIQEQQSEIEELKLRMSSYTETGTNGNDVNSGNILYQNFPNPFSESTVIKYSINNGRANASIIIFNLSGELVEKIAIESTEDGQITLPSGTLKPGKYIYSLLVNGKEADSKTMIVLD